MQEKSLFIFLFSGTVLLLFIMRWHGEMLTKFPSSKAGIISLEFAKTKANANNIITAWNSVSSKNTQQHARNNTAIDFLFIFFYSLFIFYACYWFSVKQTGLLLTISQSISLLPLLAGLLDVVENYFLIKMLSNTITDAEALLTYRIAFVKFSLVAIAFVWIIFSSFIYYISKLKTKISKQT